MEIYSLQKWKTKNFRQQWKPCISWNRKEHSDLHWVEKNGLLNTPTECCFSLSPHTWVLWFSLIGLLQWIGVPLALPRSLCLLYCVTSDPGLLFQYKCYNRFENPYGWCRLTRDIIFSRNFFFFFFNFKVQHWMDFLSHDAYEYLWLRFPATVFLGDGWGEEERNRMVPTLWGGSLCCSCWAWCVVVSVWGGFLPSILFALWSTASTHT